MGAASGSMNRQGLNRLKLFGALSRTPHGILDMTTPIFGACLWLGGLPDITVILIGLVTVFSGYTAVYALNDLVGYKVDKANLNLVGTQGKDRSNDLDSALVAHPMAQGLLSLRDGVLWVVFWSILALTGAYMLNPVCALIFILGCVLETIYCLLLKVSPIRTAVSGVVKTLGTMAAIFAVDPNPSPLFTASLFLVLFFWEIGGQNIPNDCTDIEGDSRQGARTVPILLGEKGAGLVIIITLVLGIFLTVMPLSLSPLAFTLSEITAVVLTGWAILMIPALAYYRSGDRVDAMSLFNRASYYPLFLFVAVMLKMAF